LYEEGTPVSFFSIFGEKNKRTLIQELGPWIIREDEPEIDENFMCLDWYNSHLNLRLE
jgi:hypothetical protein